MAQIIHIDNLDAPELIAYAHLTEAQLRHKLEPSMGVFIAESPKVIYRALEAGIRPKSLLMEERHLTGQGAPLLAACGDIPVYTAPREVLASLTGYTLTRGILCCMARSALPTAEDLLAAARRVAVLEGIVDSTNVGAIFRSAAALGMDAVLLSPTCCDPLTRRVVRVSMGTVFQVPWTYLGSDAAQWPEDGLAQLKEAGFATAAMALTDDSCAVDDPRLKAIDKLAIILGTEGDGLSHETIAQCDYTVKIPMFHGVDSLNVAAASAVAFWEMRAR